MFSLSAFASFSTTAGLRPSRKTSSPGGSLTRRSSVRVVAHGGVGGSGGTPYAGKDKGFDHPDSPWKKKWKFVDDDQVDPENQGRASRQAYTPPPPTQETSGSSSWDTGSSSYGAPPPPPPPPPPAPRPGASAARRGPPIDYENIDPDFTPKAPDDGVNRFGTGSASAPPPPPPASSSSSSSSSYGGGPGIPVSPAAAKRRVIIDVDNIDPDFR